MRQNVPKTVIIDYYGSNIKLILQYGMFVYGHTSYTNLLPFFYPKENYSMYFFQKKIWKHSTSF